MRLRRPLRGRVLIPSCRAGGQVQTAEIGRFVQDGAPKLPAIAAIPHAAARRASA
jgi:hypothetical protein